MQPLAPPLKIAFADLVDGAHEKAFNERFPAGGTFHKFKRGEREYWYHVMRDASAPSGRRSTYAGAVGDPIADALVERHGQEHARHKLQKESASMLRRAGLPTPDPIEGKLAQAFQRAGVFQAGAILVGSVAYQAYGGVLGVKLGGDLHRTQDIDLAQDREIALHVGHTGQKLEDFQEILKSVDATFSPKLNPQYPRSGPTRYENATRYRVDLLTAHKNSDRDRKAPVALPTHPGAALQPLDLMEFLIKNPIRSVLLYEDGVAVNVPDPARYALHKATISQMRSLAGEAGKDSKDRMQAAELLKGVEHAGRTSELADAWSELWDDKAKRRSFVVRGVLALPDDAIDTIARSAIRFGAEPFREDEKPAATLRKFISNNPSGPPLPPKSKRRGGKDEEGPKM
jgi:hypothetical protein